MRPVYSPPRTRTTGLPQVVFGAAALTLAVFLVLPLTQMVSARRESVLAIRPAELTQVEDQLEPEAPPPPPPETEPPPEPPPSLADAAPPLNLSVNLDVAFGSGGAMAMGSGFLQDAAAQAGTLDAFSVADLEKRPEVLSTVPPAYPESLRKAKTEGTVTLVFILNETGQVEAPRVESASHKEFETPALDAIRRWRFKPGLKDGQPVRTYLRQPIHFRLPTTG